MKRETDTQSAVKRALKEIRELKSRLADYEQTAHEPIAIVGIGCRFPGDAADPPSFWKLLDEGVDAITEIPTDRWRADVYYDPNLDVPGKTSSRWGGFVSDIDQFDAEFFGISPREAETLDPQHRLLLEVVWEAMEHAGQAPDRLFESKTGVFVGIGSFDYAQLQLQAGDLRALDAYFATGGCHSTASGRISYVLGLQGPSISLDTACSSSLVAVHLACQSLRAGESCMAVAAGINVILLPDLYVNFSQAHMLAADGRCKAFDERADGFVRGEGAAAVALKRLSDARNDGDRILAVISGTAINQDGRSSGLTVPNGPSQQDVIRRALSDAGIGPGAVQYVETHGTGTSLGDPIEVHALGAVFGEGRDHDHPLLIGSVKTNVGHLEAAAGLAGLIKVVLALEHERIPASLHFETPNSHIEWSDLALRVVAESVPWPRGSEIRRAGVSSFGFSGTNAHVIVEEPPVAEPSSSQPQHPVQILTASARSPRALRALAEKHAGHLADLTEGELADFAYTSNTGRTHFAHRIGTAIASVEVARQDMLDYAAGSEVATVHAAEIAEGAAPGVAFLFSGQGSQYVGMGKQLYESQPAFRAAMSRCDEILRSILDVSLLSLLYPGGEISDSASMDDTTAAQPALFALEYSLAQMWLSWGIRPSAVLGHSLGEYVASCVAGVFDLEDGLRLIAERGRLMRECTAAGRMIAIRADEETAVDLLRPFETAAAVAAVNGPESVVVSGTPDVIGEVEAKLTADGIKVHPLRIDRASHSPLMESMLSQLGEAVESVSMRAPAIPIVSNVSGDFRDMNEAPTADYWCRHARQPVRFWDGVRAVHGKGIRVFLEMGPAAALCGLTQEGLVGDVTCLPSLRPDVDDWMQTGDSLAALYATGVAVDWDAFHQDCGHRKTDVPAYPFQRKRYWLQSLHLGRDDDAEKRRWATAVVAGRKQAGQAPLDLGLHTYPAKWECMDSLVEAIIAEALRQLGVYGTAGEAHAAADIAASAGVAEPYVGLIGRWLDRMSTLGHLKPDGDVYVAQRPLAELDIEQRMRDAEVALADTPLILEYVNRCRTMLVDVLTGRESALETLFPGGDLETAGYLYEHWSVSRYFNAVVAGFAEALARTSKDMRVIEIGAGTGGTTSAVLPVFPADRVIYYYTDLSDFFLGSAAERFKQYPFVRYGTLDIERRPIDQGYGQAEFDLVIAANVIHATCNIQEAISNARALLAPGGVLLLYEVTDPPSWFDVSISLIEGFQRFEDGWRDDGPLLQPTTWRSLLAESGFAEIEVFPDAESPASRLGIHVIAARNAPEGDTEAVPIEVWADGRAAAAMPESGGAGDGGEASEVRARLAATPPSDHIDILVDFVRRHVGAVLRRDRGEQIDRQRNLMDLGIDSLMAVELRDRLSRGLELSEPLPATLIFDYPNIEAVATYVLGRVDAESDAGERVAVETDMSQARVAELEDLSEEAVEEMILKKLNEL